jgi:hypothetical protein
MNNRVKVVQGHERKQKTVFHDIFFHSNQCLVIELLANSFVDLYHLVIHSTEVSCCKSLIFCKALPYEYSLSNLKMHTNISSTQFNYVQIGCKNHMKTHLKSDLPRAALEKHINFCFKFKTLLIASSIIHVHNGCS